MPFCRLYIIVTYRNGRGFAETGKKVKKKNLHEREENGGQHVARSGRQALGREKTGKTDCCGQRHHGASLTRSPGRQYLRLNHCDVSNLLQTNQLYEAADDVNRGPAVDFEELLKLPCHHPCSCPTPIPTRDSFRMEPAVPSVSRPATQTTPIVASFSTPIPVGDRK